MVTMLLRLVFVLIIVRVVLEFWRLLTGTGVRRARREPEPPPPRKHPPLEGKIVDAEFEDLEEGKRT
jgi:hypothetical protein